MFSQFFGVPQAVVRGGIWAHMTPSEQSLYIGLLHDSERCRTRELHRSDKQINQLTGVSSRALRDARIKLQERGLIQYRVQVGRRCCYTICDPATGNPYPGDPRVPIPYVRKTSSHAGQDHVANAWEKSAESTPKMAASKSAGGEPKPELSELAVHGLPLSFK